MKKVLAVLTTGVIGLLSAQVSAEIRLGLDSAPYPPFYEADTSGDFVGWEVEIGDALCAAMDEQCEWVGVAWDGIIPALLAKKIDAIVGSMSITEERMKTISFSDKYYNTPAAIVAAKSTDIDGSPESVEGKIIGVQVSTTHQNYVENYFQDTADSIKTYQDFNEHNQDLLAGRVDAIVADSLAMADFLGSPEGSEFEIKANLSDDTIFGPGVGAGIRQEDTELVEKFNAAIKQIREDGTYDAISAKYFDFDIYGGK
ncbi:MAG: transporter substrate-binding domain-containing protein [Granulosicoccus sp.]|nr:transporter substrate-binding domain-containing protein [Granulosicoccus sp.]